MTKRSKNILMLVAVAVLAAATAWILYDNANAPYQKMEGKIFGTYYHITYQSSGDYGDDILSALNGVDNSLSTFNPQSTVSHVNRNEPTELDDMFTRVFELAQQVSAQTGGAFDITVAPLVNLWGFGFQNSDQVTQHKIDSLMATVGYQGVSIKNQQVVKQHDDTMLDFSAIAKGYACDVVASMLEGRGVSNYMIEIGGEVRANGYNSDKRQWTLGNANPVVDEHAGQQLQTTVSMPRMAIATSGNYRNFYYKDGKKYAHTIDPHTGYPVEHNLLSATVSAPTCAMADAYATAFMVMGLDKTEAFLQENENIKAYLIYQSDNGELKTYDTISEK